MSDTLDNKPSRLGEPRKLGDIDMHESVVTETFGELEPNDMFEEGMEANVKNAIVEMEADMPEVDVEPEGSDIDLTEGEVDTGVEDDVTDTDVGDIECEGPNCEAVQGVGHSEECETEHDAVTEQSVGFVAAMSAVDLGMRVRRDSWKNKGAQILFHPHVVLRKFLVIDFTKQNPGRFLQYNLTDDDKAATDWVIIDV